MRWWLLAWCALLAACGSSAAADPASHDHAMALRELARREISFDLDGLQRATRRADDDGAYLFDEAGFFAGLDDAAYLALLRHAASTRNHGLLRVLQRLPRRTRTASAELSAALVDAVEQGSPGLVRLLLDHGAEPAADALLRAAYQDDAELAQQLLAAGTSLRSDANAEAVEMAARLGHLQTLKGFVEHGDAPATQVRDALLRAALTEKFDVVKYLVEHGVDVDHADRDGCTALHYMAHDGTVEMVAYLLAQGARINRTCRGRQTPLRWAQYRDNRVVIDYLLEHGAVAD